MNKKVRQALLKRAKEQRLVRAQAKDNKVAWYRESAEDLFLRCHADLTSQQYGIMIQNYFIEKAGLAPVSPSEDRGDAVNDFGVYIEMKSNYKSVDGKYVFLQVRPWQRVGYFFITIDPDQDYAAEYYYLSFEDVHKELRTMGSYCHGTKLGNDDNEHRMYSIRFEEGSTDHKRWQANYKLNNYEEAVDRLVTMRRKYVFLNYELNKLASTILYGKNKTNDLTNEN